MQNQIGKKVIVRADKAGVFFGTLSKKGGNASAKKFVINAINEKTDEK